MLSIQSNQIKTHFSGVLRQVEQGQTFLITRHNKVVAKLLPCSSDVISKAESKNAVEAMRRLGNSLKISHDEINRYRKMGRQ